MRTATSTASILGELAEARFIAQHWQRQPLLVRGAVDAGHALVDGDELAGLACEDTVESRIVIHDPARGSWRCEDGPFDAARFATLPRHGWTLLVQSVDQHLPRVAALRSSFAFLPRWRLDDVMVSYAAEGGGVGPHFDRYDVFLIQARGRRRWELGQRCDASSALCEHPELKLLADFTRSAAYELEAGDMLYVPPGLAHWGTALGADCITCSVGFRAPSHGEIVHGAAARLAEDLGADARFQDSPESVAIDPFLINAAALGQVSLAWDTLARRAVDAALAHAFGCQVTEPRDPDLVGAEGTADADALARRLAQGGTLHLMHDPASRFAYTVDGERAVLFVDGEAHPVSTTLARGVCHGRLSTHDLCDDEDRTVLLTLLGQGSIHPG